MSDWRENIHVCTANRCGRLDRTRTGPAGYWTCAKSGRDFIDHCKDSSCPLGLHQGQTPVPDDDPGAPGPPVVQVTVGGEPIPPPHVAAHLWPELHRWALGEAMTATAEERERWLAGFAGRVPCGECRTHWRETAEADPPPANPATLFSWTVRMHNAVNRKLGKPEMPVYEAWAVWRAK